MMNYSQLRNSGVERVLLGKTTYLYENGSKTHGPVFHKVDCRLMVVYDDMDLDPGIIRIRPEGGTGGHKGIASITNMLNDTSFPRMRIGIGRPPDDTIDWVLGKFAPEEAALMKETVERAADALETWVKDGIDKAMNIYNQSRI